MEICKMLTLSMAHIMSSTNDWLLSESPGETPLVVYEKDDYGWFIWIASELFEERLDQYEGIPDDLYALMQAAWTEECDWLCLECNGEIEADLPVYDW